MALRAVGAARSTPRVAVRCRARSGGTDARLVMRRSARHGKLGWHGTRKRSAHLCGAAACLVAAWQARSRGKLPALSEASLRPFCSAGPRLFFAEAARAPRVPCVLEGGSSSARGPDAEGQQGQVLGQGGRQAQAPVRSRRSARLHPARPRGALPSASARVRARVGRAPLLPDRAGACSRPHPLRSPSPPLFLIPSGLARAARPPLSRALTAPNRARDLT